MDTLETWLAFRGGETVDFTPHKCDECGHVGEDVDLDGVMVDTGEEVWLCPACAVAVGLPPGEGGIDS